MISNCCKAPVREETDICGQCSEHSETELEIIPFMDYGNTKEYTIGEYPKLVPVKKDKVSK